MSPVWFRTRPAHSHCTFRTGLSCRERMRAAWHSTIRGSRRATRGRPSRHPDKAEGIFTREMMVWRVHWSGPVRIYDIELGDDPLWPMSRARDQAILLNHLEQNRLRLPVAPTIMS